MCENTVAHSFCRWEVILDDKHFIIEEEMEEEKEVEGTSLPILASIRFLGLPMDHPHSKATPTTSKQTGCIF